MIGKTLGQYSIVSHLGDGGMGAVYYGKNTNLDQDVALKVLHPHLARDSRLMERFKNEALIQAKLKHPNIVRVTDFVQQGTECAIVMEFIVGKTFDQLLEENGKPLPVRRVIELFLPLLSALDFAHSQGIIHRDIKPNNLILQQMHGSQIPMIMDFGVARIIGASKRMTATGTKMGTPYYMSPEQARSEREIDHRTDIYSMAVSMYEMLTGRVPFDRDSDYGLMDAIIKEPPPPVRTLNPQVPEWLEKVLLVAMAKDPGSRFASAAQFANSMTNASHPSRTQEPPRQPSTPPRGQTIPEIPPQQALHPVSPGTSSTQVQKQSVFTGAKVMWVAGGIIVLVVVFSIIFLFQSKSRGPMVEVPPASLQTGSIAKLSPTPSPTPTQPKIGIVREDRLTNKVWVIAAGAHDDRSAALNQARKYADAGLPAGILWIPDYSSLSKARMWLSYVGPIDYSDRSKTMEYLSRTKAFKQDAYGIKVDQSGKRETLK